MDGWQDAKGKHEQLVTLQRKVANREERHSDICMSYITTRKNSAWRAKVGRAAGREEEPGFTQLICPRKRGC